MHQFAAILVLVGTFGPMVASGAGLESLAPEESRSMTILGLSGEKTYKETVSLRRLEIYADGARIMAQASGGEWVPVPRSPYIYFAVEGGSVFEPTWLALDPGGKRFHGTRFGHAGIETFEGERDTGLLRVEKRELTPDPGGTSSCAVEGHSFEVNSTDHAPKIVTPLSRAKVATHQAVVAIDTDNEFMSTKFSNNTTNATNYLAQLFAGMTLFYERDIDLRLVQGDVFLRTEPDPYSQSSMVPMLNEFGGHWKDTPSLAALDRAFAMLLSGKSSNPNQTNGIAWLLTSGNYCNFTGQTQGPNVVGHFSVTQVFRFAGSTAANDVSLVAHELGHNFGAAHTHCTNAAGQQPVSSGTIDQCVNLESGLGCYGGTPACPTDNSVSGRGSLMSYCNFTGGSAASCGPVLQEFHPVHQGVLDARIATNIGAGCLAPLSSPQANLAVSITDNGAVVAAGGSISYFVNVSNAGPVPAEDVLLSYPLPAGTTFTSGIGTGWSCANAAGTIQCSRATLANGASAPLAIVIGVPGGYAGPATITSNISVDSDTEDPSTGNNSASDTTPVLTPDPNGIFCSGFNDWPCIP